MRVVVCIAKKENSERLRRLVLGEGLICEAADVVSSESLPARLASVTPDLILLDCDGPRDTVLASVRQIRQATDASIVACGPNDPALSRDVLHSGARQFVAEDRLRDSLSEEIAAVSTASAPPSGQLGGLVAFYSPNGGTGVSSIAINLSVQLAGRDEGRVALVDLKPAPSDLALLLDIAPRHTVDDLLSNWERLDRQMIGSCAVAHRSGVDVFAQPDCPNAGGMLPNCLTRESVRRLLVLMRRIYRTTVLDLDHRADDAQFEAMRLATFVGLVVRGDVPALRRARWALETAVAQGIPRQRFRLVVSRSGRGQISERQIEEALGLEVFQSIPDDERRISRAINEGRTVSEVSRLSRIHRSFGSFARNLETLRESV